MGNITYLRDFKAKKELVTSDRKPLYVSHLTGKITADSTDDDFGTRLARIRASLEKINSIINDLKKLETK